jgi:diamine N-acetyltransferase
MKTIELREISLSNLNEVADLRVAPGQTELVADNAYSIAQALLDPSGHCRAAYVENNPAGFVYTRLLNEGKLLYICRFMVDQHQQGRGVGRAIMNELMHQAFSSDQLQLIDLSVRHESGNAEGFYRKCGFIPTGEPYRGGWRMVLTREEYFQHKRANV